ncbi:alpha/beta fold hydrolase, partial [Streptomyces sp. T-3]|nr:alpha/beta fold hydrolase [Streptomyces sp. T-3]
PGSAAALAELFPRAELVVQAGAAHHPWLDDPGALTRTIAAFLDPGLHTVTVDGTRLAYRTWGEADAPPVVLLHGRCGSSLDWAELAPQLAADRRVYAVDLAGHGLSDWRAPDSPTAPGRYSLAGYRDQLAGFLRAL